MADLTTRRYKIKDPGFRVPDTLPETFVCARVYIPDDQLFIAAFWGLYETLSTWLSWERGGTKAKDAAALWKTAYDMSRESYECAEGDCGIMDARQSETVPCVLEKQIDCDGEWSEFADLRLCVPKMRIMGGVLQQDTTGNGDWVDTTDVPYNPSTDAEAPAPWPDPPVGETGECLSAANVAAYIDFVCYSLAGAMVDGLTFFQTLAVATTAVSALINLIPLAALTALITALYELVIDDWEDVRDFAIITKLTELLKCKYSSNGSMSESQWLALIDETNDWRAGLSDADQRAKWQLAILLMQLWGPVGMTISGKVWGITTYDCDAIECGNSMTWDFTGGDKQGWNEYLMGVWAGNGWHDTYPPGYDGIMIYSPGLPAMTINRVVIKMDRKNTGTNPIGQTSRYPDQSQYVYVSGDGGDSFRYIIDCALNIAQDGKFIAQIDPYSGGNQSTDTLITGVTIYYTPA